MINECIAVVVCRKMFAMDISKQLEAYEVEYHVLQEEMSVVRRGQKGHSGMGTCLPNDASNHLTRLQLENEALRRQKTDLLNQLQVLSFVHKIYSCRLDSLSCFVSVSLFAAL